MPYIHIHNGTLIDGTGTEPIPNANILIDGDKTITAVFEMGERVCGDLCHPILKGDLNEDCYINMEDFVIYIDSWLACTHPDCD